MSEFASWVFNLVQDGVADLACPWPQTARHDDEAGEVLRGAFAVAAGEIAGPPLVFAEQAALAAVEFVAAMCWQVLDQVQDAQAPRLGAPKSPADHLAGDLTLRFLPDIAKRARLRDVEHPVALHVDAILRGWPLSGVLAGIEDAPTSPLDFGGHPGLQMMYAERLALRPRTTWVPESGAGREWVEFVFHERGQCLPPRVHLRDKPDE